MTPTQLKRVLLHASFELDRLNAALNHLRAYDFPSRVADELIDDIIELNREATTSLEQIAADAELDSVGAGERAVAEYRKIMSRRRHLQVLENAKSDDVPWSLVPSIETLAASILPDRKVLITTTPDMNYMVSWSSDDSDPIVTIYLPKLHRANAFLHVLIAHELFHPRVEEFVTEAAKLVLPKLKKKCKELLESAEGPTDLFSQQRLDTLLSYAENQWKQGIRECMCDMGAIALFGPAALWTLSGFASTQNLDAIPNHENQFYPPWRLRIKRAYEYLVECDNGKPTIDELTKNLVDGNFEIHANELIRNLEAEEVVFKDQPTPATSGDGLTQIVYAEMEEAIESSREFIRDIASNLEDRWSKTASQIPSLLGRLALGVPPTEVFSGDARNAEPGSTSAIIVTCWIERIALEKSGKLDLRSYRKLCRLMLKALEDSELKREFSTWANEVK